MAPIYKEGNDKGLGYSFDTFLRRFIEICEDHLQNNRAKAFAFILYNFNDNAVKEILSEQGSFVKLDRLSGHDLSIFYLDSGSEGLLEDFNGIFFNIFNISETTELPFVLFFKLVDRDAKDCKIVELERQNIALAFHELFGVIKAYVDKLKKEGTESDNVPYKFLKLIKPAKKFGEKIAVEIGAIGFVDLIKDKLRIING